MKIINKFLEQLPKLSWLCERSIEDSTIFLYSGSAVEAGNDWFFEGAWAGDFRDADFINRPCFGTGGRIVGSDLLITPPDHFLDQIFVYHTNERIFCSNSIPFICSRINKKVLTGPNVNYKTFGRIAEGLSTPPREIPLEDGTALTLYGWHLLRIGPDLSVSVEKKVRVAKFSNFFEYEDYLVSTINGVFSNAADTGRKFPFKPLTTISAGYDSTMVSALARDAGCREAITFDQSRKNWRGASQNDSGAIGARALELDLRTFNRLGYRDFSNLPETMALGNGSEFLSAQAALDDRIVCVGYMGDTMWDRNPSIVSHDVRWPQVSGHTLTEFRLETGFIFFPIAFIAAQNQPQIVSISKSREMSPWSLNTDYDRPICRRIAETRGIPRDSFGKRKAAAGTHHQIEGLRATMSPLSYKDYTTYRKNKLGIRISFARQRDNIVRVLEYINRGTRRLEKILYKKTSKIVKIPKINAPGAPEAGLLLPWAVERRMSRYKIEH